MTKSTLKGLIGLFLAFTGLGVILGGAYMAFIAGILAMIGIVNLTALLAGFTIIVGLVLIVVGSKLFFDNETSLIRAGIAIFGIALIVAGALLLPEGVFGGLLVAALGIALLGYAVPSINVLAPLRELIEAYKSLIGSG